MIAVGSTSTIHLSFTPSQRADVLEITTLGSVGTAMNQEFKYGLASTSVLAYVEGALIESLEVIERSNATLVLQFGMLESLTYALTLEHVVNPERPGRALWTLATYERPAEVLLFDDWKTLENRRDRVDGFVGPPTYNRIQLDPQATLLPAAFFDQDGTELLGGFRVYPDAVSPGQYLILTAPFGFEFVDRTFKPGDGFPLVSGSVYVRPPQGNDAFWAYVVQIRTRIKAHQLICGTHIIPEATLKFCKNFILL